MSIPVASQQIAQRYQMLDQLGSGGMGVVYRALDRLSGQIVALKQVTIDSRQLPVACSAADSQDVRLALAHEFKTLASLRHPNIVSVIDYGFDGQRQPFFTMSLLEGAQTILRAGQKQPAEVQYGLLMQLLQAIHYLHRRGILHRDLKPDNVLVVNGQVKVSRSPPPSSNLLLPPTRNTISPEFIMPHSWLQQTIRRFLCFPDM